MDVVRIGPLEVRAIETPGHASHHHVYQWEDNLFGGDIAGVRLGGGPPIPPFVPPELDIESWIESIRKVRSLQVKKLYLPHFGPVKGSISKHLDELEERIERWAGLVPRSTTRRPGRTAIDSGLRESGRRRITSARRERRRNTLLRSGRSEFHGRNRGGALLAQASPGSGEEDLYGLKGWLGTLRVGFSSPGRQPCCRQKARAASGLPRNIFRSAFLMLAIFFG